MIVIKYRAVLLPGNGFAEERRPAFRSNFDNLVQLFSVIQNINTNLVTSLMFSQSCTLNVWSRSDARGQIDYKYPDRDRVYDEVKLC